MTLPPLRPLLIVETVICCLIAPVFALQLSTEEAALAFTVVSAGIGVIAWGLRLEGRITAIEERRADSKEYLDRRLGRIEEQLDTLVDHLSGRPSGV